MSMKEIINEGNQHTKPPKTRTPRQAESILAGALKLTLAERVELVKQLKQSITEELDAKANDFETAKATVNGL